jgi:hypothetical protein
MGYQTWFVGDFTFDPPLNESQRVWLEAFNDMRHVSWNYSALEQNDLGRAAGFREVGPCGVFYVDPPSARPVLVSVAGTESPFVEVYDAEIRRELIENDNIPTGQPIYKGEILVDKGCSLLAKPGLWCQWRPTPDGQRLEWDGGEKFYHYVEWLEWLVQWVFAPVFRVTITGRVAWDGEQSEDFGYIVARENVITTAYPDWRWVPNDPREEERSNSRT